MSEAVRGSSLRIKKIRGKGKGNLDVERWEDEELYRTRG